jgi:hypothetical protein
VKIFENVPEANWDEKVNFIDENNVVLGYDLSESCCEHADWFLSTKPETKIVDHHEATSEELLDYRFCTEWYKHVTDHDNDHDEYEYEFDEGGMFIFKIINSKGDELFIHIFNCHNGYYGHGFQFQHHGKTIQEGTL